MQYTTTLTQKGQATIPVAIRKKLGIKSGHSIIFEEQEQTVVVKAAPSLESLMGSLKTKIKYDKKKAYKAVGEMLAKRHEKITRY